MLANRPPLKSFDQWRDAFPMSFEDIQDSYRYETALMQAAQQVICEETDTGLICNASAVYVEAHRCAALFYERVD